VKSAFCEKINSTFSFSCTSPKDFVVSQWQTSEKSTIYMTYRWLIAIFYTFSFLFSFTTSIVRNEFKFHFVYLTNWNMFATMIMTVLSAILVTSYNNDRLKLSKKITLPIKIYWCLSISCTMYSVLVSSIYWGVLYKKDNNTIDLNNVLIHITNSCVLVFDIFIVKHKSTLSQFVWPLLFGVTYLVIFTLIYPFFGGLNR
jgi:hypothetical protein